MKKLFVLILLLLFTASSFAVTPIVKKDSEGRVFLLEGGFNEWVDDTVYTVNTNLNGFYGNEFIEWVDDTITQVKTTNTGRIYANEFIDVQESAIGYWKLDGGQTAFIAGGDTTGFDLGHGGNDVALHAGCALAAGHNGDLKSSTVFNGTTSYGDTGADMIGVGACTIEAWIYPVTYGELYSGYIVENGKALFPLVKTSENIRFYSNGSDYASSAENSIVLNTWYHVCVTRNTAGDETNIYITGVLSGDADQNSGTPTAGDTNVLIGNNSANDREFNGRIEGVKIHKRILSLQKIQNAANR